MPLGPFIRLCDSLVEFESNLNNNELPLSSVYDIDTHKEELQSIWHRLKQTCERCLVELEKAEPTGSTSNSVSEVGTVKSKYHSSYLTYCRTISKLSELRHALYSSTKTASAANLNVGFNLPPCDITIFNGDYMLWPTFRDLFMAVCINNPKLSPVEKLFHLAQKTKGEAHDIVAKSPLINDGFQTAWANLCARYENKRVLINGQLKTLFNLQNIQSESSTSLKELQRDINACISALGVYDIDIQSWNPIFVYVCSNRLPDTTLTLWEQTLSDKTKIPDWSELDNFLTNRHRTLESVCELRSYKDSKLKSHTKSKYANNVQTFQTNISDIECRLCSNDHHIIRKCPRFLEMDYFKRFAEIKANNLCINCFAAGHSVKQCKSKHSCFKCGKRHHTLLHKESESLPNTISGFVSKDNNQHSLSPTATSYAPHVPLQSTSSSQDIIQSCFSSSSRSVLLGTAMVNICHIGMTYEVRALIDSGSEGTFISERLFNVLKLPFKRSCAKVSGLNNTVSAEVQKECSFVLCGKENDNIEISVSALVVPQLASNLPSRVVNLNFLENLPKLHLADPHFYKSSKIDMLLGGDLIPSIMLHGCKTNICGTLMAQETIFGWIITGPIPNEPVSSFSTIVSYFCNVSIDEEISRFWEVENVPRKQLLSHSDKYCEDLYVSSTTRNKDGRYVVSLPFKEGYPEELTLGQSRSSSMAKFFRNEGRLLRNPELKSEYDKVLREYSELNHMICVKPNSDCSHYYLPHHAVIKPDSSTTKVRVVFNASAPTSNGFSLNDVLHTGPVLQSDLTILILKWRFYRYVFNGDIKQMYRQILVNPKQTCFQRILHRQNKDDFLQDYELSTVTFGVNCAPYLALRTMLQLARDTQALYPLANSILRNSMYVDDALAGAHTIEIAIRAKNELIAALNSAGFEMRKWTSNSKEILKDLPIDHLLFEDFLDFDEHSSAKTLGIRWNARSDNFYFSINIYPESSSYTKRLVLSMMSRLFDPAGWLAPVIVTAKIVMQKIWMDKTDWDSLISPEALSLWTSFISDLPAINRIEIPRWINFIPHSEIEFHGFCDASEKAYAAVLYIRTENEHGIHTHLMSSKTRVAPLKTLSIPRLELCGALLLAELIDHIIPQFEVKESSLFCWTDSMIVLSWLGKPPCLWNTFVANRVSKIIEVADPSKWAHVNTESNPADLASRGVPPHELENHNIWWKGPQWLSQSPSFWPNFNNKAYEDTDLEMKPIKLLFTYFQNFDDVLERFSSLPRALRILAYVYRFFFRTHPNYRSTFCRDSRNLSTSEINIVRNRLTVMCQKAWYSNEYRALLSKKPVSSSSSILNLNPFIDKEGIVRICGRLELSPHMSYNERHPIILPYKCQYSRLLVQYIHQLSLHGGNQLVLRLVRTSYWIPKVKNLIKTVIHNCKPCVLYRQRCQKQLMAALPPERCEISRPFSHTGLDFAGPFDIKTYTGRACRITKGYVCLFVCFSTKAIHLEATSELSTSAFLAAFTRFVSRRGCPLHMHSDNGTTFVGASKVIAREFMETSHQAIQSNYAHQNLTWHFIPPGAPHMGGLWEAGVKSFKHHFRRSVGSEKYTFEEFQTLLARIEACLNSRPISSISEDPSDLSALTPGHFLVGSPLLVPLDPIRNEAPMAICNRWQRLKVIQQQFCIRWKNEYLTELQKRHKWKTPEDDIKENMLVVIKEDNLPPNCWRLGRVVRVYQGVDKRVRVANILTQRGSVTRPVTKLVVLPSGTTTV